MTQRTEAEREMLELLQRIDKTLGHFSGYMPGVDQGAIKTGSKAHEDIVAVIRKYSHPMVRRGRDDLGTEGSYMSYGIHIGRHCNAIEVHACPALRDLIMDLLMKVPDEKLEETLSQSASNAMKEPR